MLATAAYLGADKNLARIPIDDAIHLVAGHKAKGVLPVRGEPVKLVRTSDEVSKQSNAGRPTFPVNTTPAAEKHDHKDHKDEKKEEKKDGK